MVQKDLLRGQTGTACGVKNQLPFGYTICQNRSRIIDSEKERG